MNLQTRFDLATAEESIGAKVAAEVERADSVSQTGKRNKVA
ncbi:MAG: hypothetical protein ACYDDO_08270 [Acidiferrobacterales bacterium]